MAGGLSAEITVVLKGCSYKDLSGFGALFVDFWDTVSFSLKFGWPIRLTESRALVRLGVPDDAPSGGLPVNYK